MVGRRSSNVTPSLEEFIGWYNLSEPYDDGYPVLRSVELVPEFDQNEFIDLHFEAEDFFSRLVKERVNDPFDPFAQPPFYVRSYADDRTMEVETDFGVLTSEVLRRIRSEFLGRYPLWRIVLMADHPSCSIVVYPTAIRFGNLPIERDPDEALREVVVKQLAMQDVRERPRREHFAWIQRLLPDAVKRIGDRPFLVAGVLDNYEGDYERLTICLLVPGDDRDAVIIKGPPGADRHLLWRSSAYRVSDEGVVIDSMMTLRRIPWSPGSHRPTTVAR